MPGKEKHCSSLIGGSRYDIREKRKKDVSTSRKKGGEVTGRRVSAQRRTRVKPGKKHSFTFACPILFRKKVKPRNGSGVLQLKGGEINIKENTEGGEKIGYSSRTKITPNGVSKNGKGCAQGGQGDDEKTWRPREVFNKPWD